jgi:hypothetical protein
MTDLFVVDLTEQRAVIAPLRLNLLLQAGVTDAAVSSLQFPDCCSKG